MATKPIWTEGLFLTQHHLQQQDRYHEELSAERARAVLGRDFGIAQLELDERALAAGEVRLGKLFAVFPEGTVVRAPEGVPPRSFDAAFPPQLPFLDVYVGVPREAPGIPAVDLDGRLGDAARYTRVQEKRPDVNTGMGAAPVEFGRANLRLLFGEERRDAYETLRVAQLVRSPAGTVVFRETFVPPIFHLSASPWLVRSFRGLLGIMTARQRSLTESRRQRSAASVEFDAQDVARLWLLSTLNASIPGFAHVVDHETTSLETAYLLLVRLVGELTTFAVDGDPAALPKLSPSDPAQTFEPLFQRAEKLLSATVSARAREIPLSRDANGVLSGALDDAALRSELFLTVTTTLPEAQVRERLPKLLKLASGGQIGAILHSAINGVRIDLEYRPPNALPIKPGMIVYRVAKSAEFWSDVVVNGTLAIYHPFDQQSLTLQVFSVDPSSGGAG